MSIGACVLVCVWACVSVYIGACVSADSGFGWQFTPGSFYFCLRSTGVTGRDVLPCPLSHMVAGEQA